MAPKPDARVKRLNQGLKTLAPHVPDSLFVPNIDAPQKGNIRQTMDETMRSTS